MAKKRLFVEGITQLDKAGRVFLIKDKKCLRCKIDFKSIFTKKEYCSRKCYLLGAQERSTCWLKTEAGHRWKLENQTKNSRQRRIRALIKLGGKCTRCGFNDLRALHIDHVYNDGKTERKVRKSIEHGIWVGTVDVSRYQLLCANCNWIKRTEQAEVGKDDYNSYIKTIEKTITLSKKDLLLR